MRRWGIKDFILCFKKLLLFFDFSEEGLVLSFLYPQDGQMAKSPKVFRLAIFLIFVNH